MLWTGFTTEALDRAPAISPDRRAVVFTLSLCGLEVEGVIARDAPEECFWLPRGTHGTLRLTTFENGRNRISAVAQRKRLARPDGRSR
ncbi:uncharacterized protein DUF1488 [Paraburkholderia sp. BL27I4N3]|nr:uncharacterized protein DUF1488 [Paraburkholderia sp. BL27I4N3]